MDNIATTESLSPAASTTSSAKNVFLGGPTVGVTLGNPAAGKAAFLEAAKGRSTGSYLQSYGNCGVEAARQLRGEIVRSIRKINVARRSPRVPHNHALTVDVGDPRREQLRNPQIATRP